MATAQNTTVKEPVVVGGIYSREDLIRISGFSVTTIWREERAGKLKTRRVGRRVFFLGEDVLKWLKGEQ